MAPDIGERPNSIPWPPLLYLGGVAAGLLLECIWPTRGIFAAELRRSVMPVGWLLMAAGGLFDLAAMLALSRHKANILPHRAATRLVTSGPFAVSRNPIYLGNTLLMAGAALAFGNIWLLVCGLMAALAVRQLAILREEAHLAARFGDEWHAYAGRTRRWFGWRS